MDEYNFSVTTGAQNVTFVIDTVSKMRTALDLTPENV